MHNLLILGCSATKRLDAGRMPAYERYDGPMYRVLRCWQRQNPGWESMLTVWVVSARYGLFDATIPIPVYEQRMSLARAQQMRQAITRSWPLYTAPTGRIHISLGAAYAPIVASCPWPAAYATGGIGERLAQLKAWLASLAAVQYRMVG